MAQGILDPLLQVQIDAINKRLEDQERIALERFNNIKENLQSALTSADRAINKAEDAANKRFESVNEFRAALSDQTQNFVRQSEYNTRHQSLSEKLEALTNQLVAIDATVRNRLSTIISGPAFFISSISAFVIIALALVSGAIQLGTLQTHVSINTDTLSQMLIRERIQDANTAIISSAVESMRTRQVIAIERLDRVEKQVMGK